MIVTVPAPINVTTPVLFAVFVITVAYKLLLVEYVIAPELALVA